MPEDKVCGVITPQAMRRSRAACTASSSWRTHQLAIPLAESMAVSFSTRNWTICSERASPSRVARMEFITPCLNGSSMLVCVAARRGCESCATLGPGMPLAFRNPTDSQGLTIFPTLTECHDRAGEPSLVRGPNAILAFGKPRRGSSSYQRQLSRQSN